MAIGRRRVSRKSKLSWRKHVDITDVEAFLEDQRLEERLGPNLETLTDEQLFSVDTKAALDESSSTKQKKRLKLLQPPKCFAILEPHTKVPDPITKRNRVKSKEERKNELIKQKERANHEKGILKYREFQASHDRTVNENKNLQRPKRGEFNQNIWSDDAQLSEKNYWFSKTTIKHNLVGTEKRRKTIRTPVRPKASVLPPIDIPHPGTSYNPTYGDHQDLLKSVAEKEMKIIKEEEHLNRVTRAMFSRVTQQQKENMWMEEMSQGLPDPTKNKDENEMSDGEYKAINSPAKNKKKTLQQRRKQIEQMQMDLKRRKTKIDKKKISDLHQIRSLNKHLDVVEKKAQHSREIAKKNRALKKKLPKRLSSMKFEETDVDFNMGRDISGNLRNLKKEGNLLTDRFKSLQKRNIIQPTIRKHRKKPKVKVYTKPGHKDDWHTTVAKPVNIKK